VTRTPVSTNGTFSSIPKKGTSGFQKKKILPDSYFGGLREYYTEKWLKNSKKNSLVLGGLTKKLSKSSSKYGLGIRDPEKTHSGSWIQGSKRHRIPDPGSGSATLLLKGEGMGK
jgi:hypothetical protein